MITWLHLSDLHIRAGDNYTWDRDIVLRKLLEDVRERLADDALHPDLIAVTGDIAFSGQSQEDLLAGQFFDELLKVTGLAKDRLLIVPGNHDVDRKLISRGANAIATSLDNRQALHEVLTSDQDRPLLLRRFDAYARFVNDYFSGQLAFDDERYFYTRSFNLAGCRVDVLGLNSAWLAAGAQDRGNLALGERQVRQALDASREANLRIALMHHPFDWLREFDRDDCEALLMEGCGFILHGHLHRAGLLSLRTPDSGAMMLAAGAAFESREFPNGCNWVRLDYATGKGTVFLRAFSDKHGGFWTKDVTAYKNVNNGEFVFTLPSAFSRQAASRRTPSSTPAMSAAETALWKKKYLAKMFDACCALPLATLGGEAGVDKDVTLDQVYVHLNTTTSAPLTEEDMKASKTGRARFRQEKDSRPLTAWEAAGQSSKLALLGEAGAGKSTFARKLLGCLASANRTETELPAGLPRDLLPIQVILRDLTPRLAALSLDNLDANHQQQALAFAVRDEILDRLADLEVADFAAGMREALESGQCLLVLDGLDEVPCDLRARVRQAALAVIRQYHLARVILTCRVRSYVGDAVLPGFQAHTLAPFDEEQIGQFARAWYNAQKELGRVNADQADDKARNLSKAAISPDLRELSANPMMLTAMAIIHQKEVGLPKERVRLYNLAVDVLLLRWQKGKTGAAGLAPSPRLTNFLRADLLLRQVMERLAYESHRAGQGKAENADLGRGTALTILEGAKYLGEVGLAAEFLDYVDQRAGLLIGRGGDPERPVTYSFPHRTFQEYLAGCYLVGQRDAAREFFARAGEGDYWNLAAMLGAEELYYNRRNTIGLLDLAYRLCPSPPPGDDKCKRALVWSGRMAALVGGEEIQRDTESPDGGKAYLERLIPRLTDLMKSDWLVLERAEAGRALGQLGDPRPGVGLKNGLPDLGWIKIPPEPFIMGSKKGETRWKDESPQFKCKLITKPYQISRYPVTVAQYQAFVDAGGYTNKARNWWTKAGWKWKQDNKITGPEDYDAAFQTPNHPRVGVSWFEAVAFCRWLSERLQQQISLPSEAEWERAARHTDARTYPWPDPKNKAKVAADIAQRCNMSDTGIGHTSAVGMFPNGRAQCEAADMAGNVWEWTRSLFGKDWRKPEFGYPYNPADGREDLNAKSEILRVLRGGSWYYVNPELLRCSYRSRGTPDFRYHRDGFRCVCWLGGSAPG